MPEPRGEAVTRPWHHNLMRPGRRSSRPTWPHVQLLPLGGQPHGKLWVIRERLPWPLKTWGGRAQPLSAGSLQAGGGQEVQGHSVHGGPRLMTAGSSRLCQPLCERQGPSTGVVVCTHRNHGKVAKANRNVRGH